MIEKATSCGRMTGAAVRAMLAQDFALLQAKVNKARAKVKSIKDPVKRRLAELDMHDLMIRRDQTEHLRIKAGNRRGA
jgi:hypothetical protein